MPRGTMDEFDRQAWVLVEREMADLVLKNGLDGDDIKKLDMLVKIRKNLPERTEDERVDATHEKLLEIASD